MVPCLPADAASRAGPSLTPENIRAPDSCLPCEFQSAKSLQRLQDLVRESIQNSTAALELCTALEREADELKRGLEAQGVTRAEGRELHLRTRE